MAGIAIDLVGVEAVLARLRVEVGEELAPVVHRGLAAIGAHALFGVGSPSGEVAAARTAYSDAAAVCVENLTKHLSNAEHMIAQLEQALEGYRQADAQAAAATSAPVEEEPQEEDLTLSAGGFGAGFVSGFVLPFRPPGPPEPRQYVTPHCLDWGAYDVPRDAVILQREGDDGAYRQAMEFRALADGLFAHYWRLLELRDALAMVWSPQESEAAQQYQDLFGRHLGAVVQDAAAASTNANLFYGIVDALAKAKGHIDDYHARWVSVTTDWTPEFWDHAAEELNGMARAKLVETDNTVRDWRSGIIVNDSAAPFAPPPQPPPGPAASGGSGGYSASPMPGSNPVTGPSLAGAPQPVPLSGSNPQSMLPIPPGVSPLAPSGGAWVLPGPGTGPLGRMMPMPAPVTPSPVAGGAAASRGPAVRPPATGHSGLVGGTSAPHAAVGGQAGRASKPGGGKVGPGAGREKWEVRQGVPPVIDATQPAAAQPAPPHVTGERMEFDSWYARTATPWRA